MRFAKTIEFDVQTDGELRVQSQRKRVEVRLQQRARRPRLSAKGVQNEEIEVELGLDRGEVALWRERFLGRGRHRRTAQGCPAFCPPHRDVGDGVAHRACLAARVRAGLARLGAAQVEALLRWANREPKSKEQNS